MAFTPDPATPIPPQFEDEPTALTAICTPDDPAAVIAGYAHAWSQPMPSQVEVSANANGAKLAAPNWIGTFRDIQIDYLKNGQPGQCAEWDDLPVDAEDVYAYRPPALAEIKPILTVTALFEDGAQEQASYEFTIRFNHTPGRDRLKEEVDARRR